MEIKSTAFLAQKMADIKSQLAAIFPQPPDCPPGRHYASIAALYEMYKTKIQTEKTIDPLGNENVFKDENFPHLVKLEFYDEKQCRWVDANATKAIEQLKSKTLDESKYRIGDESRPRTLLMVPDILRNPDSIFPNKRNRKSDVYAKRYRRKGNGAPLKIVLVETRRGGERVVKTSFWCTDNYHDECIAHPAKHGKK